MQNKMLEQAKGLNHFHNIARNIITEDRKSARRPGLLFYINLADVNRIKGNILSWGADETDEIVKRNNQKQFLLRPHCFKDLVKLLAVNDPILGELGINDEEIRSSLDKGIDYRQENALRKIRHLLVLSTKPESGITPEIFFKLISFYSTELDDLRKFRRKLFPSRSSNSYFNT